jgi:hypothetical protein
MGLRPCRGLGNFTVLGPNKQLQSLAGSLQPCVDKIRDLNTVFGIRPYIVRMVWTRWSEGYRGDGVEEVIMEQAILPTPVVNAISNLDVTTTSVGNEEFGMLKLSEVSGRFTEDYLEGKDQDGRPIDSAVNFYYEIEYPHQDGTFPGVRRRFELAGAPEYMPSKFQWEISLVRAGENRTRDGTPED